MDSNHDKVIQSHFRGLFSNQGTRVSEGSFKRCRPARYRFVAVRPRIEVVLEGYREFEYRKASSGGVARQCASWTSCARGGGMRTRTARGTGAERGMIAGVAMGSGTETCSWVCALKCRAAWVHDECAGGRRQLAFVAVGIGIAVVLGKQWFS